MQAVPLHRFYQVSGNRCCDSPGSPAYWDSYRQRCARVDLPPVHRGHYKRNTHPRFSPGQVGPNLPAVHVNHQPQEAV